MAVILSWKRLATIRNKFLLYSAKYLLFSLLQLMHVFVGFGGYDRFYLVHVEVHINWGYFVVYPVGLSFVHGCYDSVYVFFISIAVVLEKLGEVSTFEETTHPVFLFAVLQNAIALK